MAADPLAAALDWTAAGRKVALATVVSTWGSSPRPVGSQLVVADDGGFEGSVSGGCIEGAVVTEALDAIATGKARVIDFGVTDEQAWDVGLACGGEMRVHIARFDHPELYRQAHQGRPAAVLTRLPDGAPELVGPADAPPAVAEALRLDRSGVTAEGDGEVFIHVFNPAPRLIIVGAVHIAQFLAPMANLAGFGVIVIDPRAAFATPERFADCTLINAWPDEAMAALTPDCATAVVALVHDPKIDDPALAAGLRSQAFYLGALGSRKNHARRLQRLGEMGFGADDLARIRGPVGLDLGGRKPAEIAVSILAQIIQTKCQP